MSRIEMLPSGYLEIIVGPMFSGKTTYLTQIYNQLYETQNVKVINFSGDTRYHSTMLSTHDKVMIPCVFTNLISEACDESRIADIDVILINEGQFFPDGDFKRRKFGKMLDLIPLCDKVTKLSSNCNCGKPAIFSHRIISDNELVLIGSDMYLPLCRDCYQTSTVST
jgi:thymidine kinase